MVIVYKKAFQHNENAKKNVDILGFSNNNGIFANGCIGLIGILVI